MSTALAIFVKTPGLSPVKTRLARSIGAVAAEHFYLLSTKAVASVAQVAGQQLVPYWAVAEDDATDHPRWQDLPTLSQGQGSLGERLDTVCSALLEKHESVLLAGADAPQITADLLHAAQAELLDADSPFVLGPARDGGFWLFGTRIRIPRQAWLLPRYSSPTAASDLSLALEPLGNIAKLPTLTDADFAGDLESVRLELDALSDPLPAQLSLKSWLHSYAGSSAESALRI